MSTVKAFVDSPLKPDKLAPELILNVPVDPVFSVPLPDKVPFNVIVEVPLTMVGPLPSGKLQLLFIVTAFPPLLLNVTRLKVALLHANVPPDPSNVTVPLLALKVVPLFSVKPAAKVAVPLGAVKLALD